MIKILLLISLLLSAPLWSQSSMRRCTLLPVTDSVGGAIGFKIFEAVESELKQSSWCTYVSNAGLINVFSRYRENLPAYLKTKEVLSTVAEKLKVGSVIKIALVSEISGIEVQIDIYGGNGEDLYFSEKTFLNRDDIELVNGTVKTWLEMYSKMIPYDAQIMGVLGDQITLDVGKGYPIRAGQKFKVKRPIRQKKHPLLKKIVDWDTEILGEGSVFSISDNQALGQMKIYRNEKKLAQGDWVRLEDFKEDPLTETLDTKEEETLGTLGVLSIALYNTNTSVDTTTASGSRRMKGNLPGIDFRAEGWITRQYFAALQITRTLGNLRRTSGEAEKASINVNNGSFKALGGYKYLPIGFFYGPQIDIYGGYANHSFDLDLSPEDGLGRNSIYGFVLGTAANIPLNRQLRFYARGEFIPFPSFKDEDDLFNKNNSVTSMELELGVKYQYTVRVSIDASLQSQSRKARFDEPNKEISYKDNVFKVGGSFNF
jgi:hypothetical protein